MRKLMKKKLSFFGKEVSVFVIVLVGLAVLGTAALVPYISNMVVATFSVDAPITLEIMDADEGWNTESVSLGQLYGGDSFEFSERVTYNSHDNETRIYLNLTTRITNDIYNATCEDFTELIVNTPTDIDTPMGTIPAGDVDLLDLGLCENVVEDGEQYAMIKIPAKYGWPGDNGQEYDIRGTFALNVEPADYKISTVAEK